jgi:hypothetical protein
VYKNWFGSNSKQTAQNLSKSNDKELLEFFILKNCLHWLADIGDSAGKTYPS